MQLDTPLFSRRQLQGLGLSRYQAAVVTKGLAMAQKQGNAGLYKLADVLSAARVYLGRQRIQPGTRQAIADLIEQLQAMLGNVVKPDFGGAGDADLRRALNQLRGAIADSDRVSAKLKARAKQLKAQYGAPV